jgi:hydrogenase maturation protease
VNRALANQVADAVLYEGYMLYPYRPSAIKNRQRWSFGILYPPQYPEVAAGTERCLMHSEVLLESLGRAHVQIRLRFLHLLARRLAKCAEPSDAQHQAGNFQPMSSLVVGNDRLESWDEGVERSVNFDATALAAPQEFVFRFPSSSETELLRDPAGQLAGVVRRTQHEITGTISVTSNELGHGLYKLAIDIANTTPLPRNLLDRDRGNRDDAMLRSLVSAHTILTAGDGTFVSLLDPPDGLRDAAAGCRNRGNFPVLVGTAPERDMLLCSPIILYDYPQIAPESANTFYDATEMDEMLTLRVLTLTGEEKDAMRLADDHVRNLLERTELSAREQLSRTHGAIRSLRPEGRKLGEPGVKP